MFSFTIPSTLKLIIPSSVYLTELTSKLVSIFLIFTISPFNTCGNSSFDAYTRNPGP